jgi:hypothetical protein
MNLLYKSLVLILFSVFVACNNKNIENGYQEITQKTCKDFFYETSAVKLEMIYPIEYYKSKIIENQLIFRHEGELSEIIEIKNIIPSFLCFLAGWSDHNTKNSFIILYTFDKNHNFFKEYLVGNKQYLNNYRNILIENLPGNKINPGLVSIGDFNNDGINEVLSYSLHPPHFYYVFSVFGYDVIENDFVLTLLVPIFINFENMFSPVEYIENGFRILEIIDDEYLDLSWNDYVWDVNIRKYLKK